MLMRTACVLTLATMMWASGPFVHAQEEADTRADAKALFDELFGGEVRRVTATSDPADDLQMARTLLEAAKTTTGKPDLVAVLAEQAAALASKSPEGGATSEEALRLLMDTAPDRRIEALKQIVDATQRQYLQTPTADRPAAGDRLIDTMLELADAQLEANDPSEALLTYRRAGTIATSIRSDRRDEIKALMDEAVAAQRTKNLIDATRARLQANNQDKAAAAELVRLHVVELDDPIAARKYTFLIDDEATKTNIRLASTPPGELSKDQAMGLATWYRDLAGTAGSLRTRAAMYQHAADYYDTFLALHTDKDLTHTKATLERKQVGDQLAALAERLGPSGLPVSRGSGVTGQWLDVVAATDPAKQARGQVPWRKDEQGLHSPTHTCDLALPVKITGGYDLEMVFARGEVRAGRIVLQLPVGDTSVMLFLYTDADDLPNALSFIEGQRVQDEANPTRFKYPLSAQSNDYTIGVKVRARGDQASLTVSVDGKAGTQWSGPIDKVAPRYELDTGHNFNISLYKAYGHVRSLRVRGADGGKVEAMAEQSDIAAQRVGETPRPATPNPAQAAQMMAQIRDAWQRATPEQRQFIATQLRNRLDQMSEAQRDAIMTGLKRSDDKDAHMLYKMLRGNDG